MIRTGRHYSGLLLPMAAQAVVTAAASVPDRRPPVCHPSVQMWLPLAVPPRPPHGRRRTSCTRHRLLRQILDEVREATQLANLPSQPNAWAASRARAQLAGLTLACAPAEVVALNAIVGTLPQALRRSVHALLRYQRVPATPLAHLGYLTAVRRVCWLLGIWAWSYARPTVQLAVDHYRDAQRARLARGVAT